MINDLIPGGSYETQLRVDLSTSNQTNSSNLNIDDKLIEPNDNHIIYDTFNFTTLPNTYVLSFEIN